MKGGEGELEGKGEGVLERGREGGREVSGVRVRVRGER